MSLNPTQSEPQSIKVGTGEHVRTIAYRQQAPANDHARADNMGLIWLPGLKSDMVSTKATALSQWAPEKGFTLTRFDYSGHGESSGRFEDAVISDWIQEARTVLETLTIGPQILLGSSTGGHIALVLLRRLLKEAPEQAARIKGLALIAPAWDLTEQLMWKKFPEQARRDIEQQGYYDMPSDYGEPYRITRAFIEDGRTDQLITEPFNPGVAVHVLQGGLDEAVPPAHARAMSNVVTGNHIHLTEIADGDHSLNRPEDLALLFDAIEKAAGD